MDRRQQKTRAAIFEAFYALLEKKSYSSITVQEIIDTANVGRSTFYAHFETRDALLKEICTDLFEHVISSHARSESTHDFSESDLNADSIVTHILYHLRDSRGTITGLLGNGSCETFTRYFRQYLGILFRREWGSQLENRDIAADFLLNHMTATFVEMVRWWVQDGMKEPPEQMERYFAELTGPILHS